MHELVAEAEGLLEDVTHLRRGIHRQPELGLDLPLTQAKVLDALHGLPLEIRRGVRTTSVVADLRGSQPGRTIILRGDMDALPLQEDTDVPFKSSIDGRMHACGHDAHTAMLVGAARLLSRRQAALHGTVRFMFQPGEEGYAGAVVMLDEGLLEAPSGGRPAEAAFALHATPRWAPGTLHGLEAEVTNHAGYPVTVNDADFARFVIDTGRDILGVEHSIEQPSPQLAAEDFAYVLERIPGAMSSLGTRPVDFAEGEAPNAHSNRYLLNEAALASGVAMYAGVALAYLNKSN